MTADELKYPIALTQIPKIGSMLAKQLISYCGSAEAVFSTKKSALLKIPGIGSQLADTISRQNPDQLAEEELAFIEKHQIQALYYLSEKYPHRLKHFPDCPVVLYYKGTADLNHQRIVSVVGTRKQSLRGKGISEAIIEGLQAYNVLVVSGLAYGVDVTAHKKCLALNIPTVGVLGHGLKHLYPNNHRTIAQQMSQQGGLLTEYISDTAPKREHFPMRNRIVAGLCDALIVIETARKGGSMITAEIANAYNKDVFAVPGRLNDKYSQGCLHLIKSHKAALLESAKDIAYVMRWEKAGVEKPIQQRLFEDISPKERNILNLLQKTEQMGVDQLTLALSLPSNEMASLLLEMEFKGILKTLPGKQYMLVS